MDPLIDLTFKRDFKNKKKERRFVDLLGLRLKTKCPWKTPLIRPISLHSDNDLDFKEHFQYYNVIIPGDKIERSDFRERRYYNSRICDRCGKPLGRIPWQYTYDLCKDCYKFFDKKERICWKEEEI